jgi:hypothetical protein
MANHAAAHPRRLARFLVLTREVFSSQSRRTSAASLILFVFTFAKRRFR